MQVRKRLTVLIASFAVATGALLSVASSADAQAGPPPNVRLDVHGNLGWYGNGGAGVRVDIPIVREGFLRANGVSDDLSISPGVDFLWWYRSRYEGIGFIPMVMVQWNIYLGDRWSILLELGVALLWGPERWNRDYYSSYIAPTGQVGFRWHFSRSNALLVRVGWPAGLQVGITFDL